MRESAPERRDPFSERTADGRCGCHRSKVRMEELPAAAAASGAPWCKSQFILMEVQERRFWPLLSSPWESPGFVLKVLQKISNKSELILSLHALLTLPLESFQGSLGQKIIRHDHQRGSTKTGAFLGLYKTVSLSKNECRRSSTGRYFYRCFLFLLNYFSRGKRVWQLNVETF